MEKSTQPHRATIVLIDNNEALLGVLKLLLERNDYEAITFSDGRNALNCILLDSNNIDLVITDLHMPLSGIEIIDKIRVAGIHLPIMVLSASMDRELHDCLVYRGIQLIAKPVSGQEFLHRIKDALTKGKVN